MSKPKRFLTIGVWVIILPYLGFPITLKNILFVLTGLLIMYMSYGMYLENKKNRKEKRTFDNFSENKDFGQTVQ
jgi:hypothetical protein